MVTIAIVSVLAIAMLAAADNNEWGSVAVGVILIVLILMFGSALRRDLRAHENWIEYWQRRR